MCENILNRKFHAPGGGAKWAPDMRYPHPGEGRVYLTVVLDLPDRKAAGWAFSAGMETAHTTSPAVDMAARNRGPQAGLIFHSDRGVQYCAKSFRETPLSRRGKRPWRNLSGGSAYPDPPFGIGLVQEPGGCCSKPKFLNKSIFFPPGRQFSGPLFL